MALSGMALSGKGRALADHVMGCQRTAIASVMKRMPAELRHSIGPALDAFAQAAGEVAGGDRFVLRLEDTDPKDVAFGERPGLEH